MKSCFGYVRVSTQKQGEGVSLEAQRDAIERFAFEHQINVTKWFEEKQTAAKRGRPVFASMITALKNSNAEGVIMHRIDRSARNFFDWAKLGELADAGIDVHFATESLDFSSRGGRLAANVQMAVAEDYCRNLSIEAKKGLRGRIKQGIYPFAAPIGYVDNGSGQLKTVDPVRGPLVQTVFELYASGRFSITSIVPEMKERGLRGKIGRPVSRRTIENVLQNPFYCGLIRLKRTGEVFPGHHEPLITAELFETVQHVKSGKAGKKVTRHNFTYRGLFRCALCKGAMSPERQKGHVYYRCHSPECATTGVREEQLETGIEEVLGVLKLREEDIEKLSKQVEELCARGTNPETSKLHAMQLEQIEKRLEKLDDAAIEQIVDKATHGRRKQALLLERVKIEDAQAKAAKLRQQPAMLRRFFERLKNLAEHYHFAPPEEKRQIAEIATSNRLVDRKKLVLEPANWLVVCRDALAIPSGGPVGCTSRRQPELRNEQLEALIEAASSEVVCGFLTASDTDDTGGGHLFSR